VFICLYLSLLGNGSFKVATSTNEQVTTFLDTSFSMWSVSHKESGRLVLLPKATTGLEPIGYRGALLSSLLHVTVYVTRNLLNALVQIANKMGFKRKKSSSEYPCGGGLEYLHRSPASRKRLQKGNPLPGGITGPLCSWGI
jgi:hypothetical protein